MIVKTFKKWIQDVNEISTHINSSRATIFLNLTFFEIANFYHLYYSLIRLDLLEKVSLMDRQKPHAIMEQNFQLKLSLNFWAGIINGQHINPHIMPLRLNGQYIHEI